MFAIEESPRDLADKLVRRHPHVFADATIGSAEEQNESWERLKIAEKGRTSAVDGVPLGPAGVGARGQAGASRATAPA